MQKLKGLNTLNSKVLIKLAHKNISTKMRLRRYFSGIDVTPEQFLSIGKEFKTEIKNNNLNRAVEVLGKYNDRTLSKIMDYNNPLMNLSINLNNFPFAAAMKKDQNSSTSPTPSTTSTSPTPSTTSTSSSSSTSSTTSSPTEDKVNKESNSADTNANNPESPNPEAKKSENLKKNPNNFEIFNYAKSYEKIFTPSEIEMIKEISTDKEKLVEFLKANSISLDSLILKSNYTNSINVKGFTRESKLIYILLALFVFWMSYDVKGTFKFFNEHVNIPLIHNFDWRSMTFIPEEDRSQQGGKKITEIEKEGADISSQLSKSMNKFKLAKNLSERLSDVKGIDEVRSEIEEIVLMLKNPSEYEDVGAKLIRGILLIGKPGTGKTLLARALAGESGVNFIYLNASEFDKSLVGAGSKMLKEMFEFAKLNKPCIVFIDEIDTLLHKGRRSGKYSSTYERGLINTFLAEMDGFNKREHIFVLGATNSEKDLDPAALRPGRFDKIVHVPLPDSNGRKEIFDYYLSKIKMPLAEDVLAPKLASITPGFSGAEIENMVNLAIIDAVDTSKPSISKEEFENARDRVVLGIKRKPKNVSDRVLLQTAIHEAGHTLVCFKDKICNKSIHKVTILPRGETKGATSTFQDDDFQGSKEDFISLIDMSLAGIMAEEIYFGDQKMGTGCGRDLERANRIAKQMVQKFAMNKFGYMVIDEGTYLHHRISEDTRNEMDQSVGDMLNSRSDLVKEILNTNISELKLLAQNLVEYGELDRTDIDNIFQGKKVEKAEDKKLRNVIIDNIPI